MKLLLLFFSATATATLASSQAPALRHLPTSSCSRLQYTIQKAILSHDWAALSRLRFQQRLKLHPSYIVTIQSVRSLHDPLIELRCPGDRKERKLEIYFHESRFIAESVRLFDIHSIFPIHTGKVEVRIRLRKILVFLDKGSDVGVGVERVVWAVGRGEDEGGASGRLEDAEISTKEHREDDSVITELEKEIEGVFRRRIQPDVERQIEGIVRNSTKTFLEQSGGWFE